MLLDNNLSWLVELIGVHGIDAIHVHDLGLADAPDDQAMLAAQREASTPIVRLSAA